MKDNKKFVIAIEETIVQEFEILAASSEQAMSIAEEQYRKGILVLSHGEAQFRQMAIVKPENQATEWCEF